MLPGKPGTMPSTVLFSPGPKIKRHPQNMCAQQPRGRRLCRNTGGERERQDHPSRPLWFARQQASWETTLMGFLLGLGSQLLLKLLTSRSTPVAQLTFPAHRLGLIYKIVRLGRTKIKITFLFTVLNLNPRSTPPLSWLLCTHIWGCLFILEPETPQGKTW